MIESRITAAGQTTIPASIRQRLALNTGDKLRYFIEGDRVLIVPAHKSLKRLKGRLSKPEHSDNPKSLEDMDQALGNSPSNRYLYPLLGERVG